ncbi:MAG TPA: restriction endonuclease subunit S [Candidatus Angelobacter sp.]|nr:restriction endonuclease subunit S [Candidatus Angelobacter sp.]
MKYTTYPEYKDSAVVWVGELPAHWQKVSLRWVCRRYAGGTPDKTKDLYWDEGTIPWINSGAVNQTLIAYPSAYITPAGYTGSSAKWIPAGALVMALAGQGKTKGMVAQLGISTTCNQSMAAIVPDHRVNARFLLWWLFANYHTIRNLAGGEQRDGLNLDILGALPVPVLSDSEQVAIACFLDRKTAEIDTLVDKKRILIEKLKEKRSALISRTVTRGLPPEAARAAGLNPHPKLKPSGVEWLGEVPAHWRTAQLRRFTRMVTSGSRGWAEYYTDEGDIFIRIGNLTRNSIQIDLMDVQYVSPPQGAEGERTRIKAGDLLFSITAYLGSVAVASASVVGGYINQHIALVRLDTTRLLPEFAGFAMLADLGQNQFAGFGYGGTKVQLSLDDVKSLWLPIPPVSEQRIIADFLDRETAKIDHMVAKVEEAIERLQEYRAALITAAVTGKIDVRQEQNRRKNKGDSSPARVGFHA